MKSIYTSILVIALTLFIGMLNAQSTVNDQGAVQYDSLLAKELGGNDNGMKKYVMAFLKSGPYRTHSKEEATTIQKAHMDNIIRMAEEGKLVVAGPFLDDGELRGIYIFNVETIEEAQTLTETDPAVQSGRLIMELHPWYGSAALMKVTEIHNRIQKNKM